MLAYNKARKLTTGFAALTTLRPPNLKRRQPAACKPSTAPPAGRVPMSKKCPTPMQQVPRLRGCLLSCFVRSRAYLIACSASDFTAIQCISSGSGIRWNGKCKAHCHRDRACSVRLTIASEGISKCSSLQVHEDLPLSQAEGFSLAVQANVDD